MSEETIVTLSNGKKYKILSEGNIDSKKYCFTVILNETGEETEEYLFFEVLNNNGKEVMKIVNDKDLQQQLTVFFTAQYCNYVDSVGGK